MSALNLKNYCFKAAKHFHKNPALDLANKVGSVHSEDAIKGAISCQRPSSHLGGDKTHATTSDLALCLHPNQPALYHFLIDS